MPAGEKERAEVLALQARCDEELGPDARRVGYQVALENPAMMVGTLLYRRAPKRWLNPILLRFIERVVRRKFAVHPDEVERSRARLHRLLPELQEKAAGGSGFMVGDRFGLADITVAALFDPLEIVPEFVRDPRYAPLFDWKRRLMREHRRRQRTPWLSGPPPPGYPRL